MIDVVLTSVKENWKIIGMVCSKIDGSLGDSRLAYVATAYHSPVEHITREHEKAEYSWPEQTQQNTAKHNKALQSTAWKNEATHCDAKKIEWP